MKKSNVHAEALTLVRALPLVKSVWLTARAGPRFITATRRYWAELRSDVLLLYPAKNILHAYRSARPSENITQHFLESITPEQVSSTAAPIISTDVLLYALPAARLYMRDDTTYISIKCRNAWFASMLLLHSVPEATQWLHILTQAQNVADKTLSDFTVIRHIGKGASGRVYLVEDNDHKEQLALKVIEKSSVYESDDSYRHALDERLVLQMTRNHPYILDMRYAFQNAKRLFLITEFCPGGDLFEYMNSKCTPMDEQTARMVTAQILMAMEHIHSFGVVYRDLKLENILIDDQGNIRIADFGLSKLLRKNDGELKRTDTFCGTREYVAPEMLGGQSYDTSIDLWAFGILLYELLSGRTPFYSKDRNDIYRRIEKAPIYYPRNLSQQVRHLIAQLLRRDVSERLGTGEDGWTAVKEHPWFKSVDWIALGNKSSSNNALKKHVEDLNSEATISSRSSGKRTKKEVKQAKALAILLADVEEDMRYVSSLSDSNVSKHMALSSPLMKRPRTPLSKRGDGILAGYSFCSAVYRTPQGEGWFDGRSIGSSGDSECEEDGGTTTCESAGDMRKLHVERITSCSQVDVSRAVRAHGAFATTGEEDG